MEFAGIEQRRASQSEQQRTKSLLDLLPADGRSVLDIGARDGYFSVLLTRYFPEVTALDLERPAFEHPGVITVKGDVTKLQFPDSSFDCVFCAEVLEHIHDLQAACDEIVRVARRYIVIGVPFRQDIRLGRTTCNVCGYINPPWGHVNSFTEEKLQKLFASVRLAKRSFVGSSRAVTSALSMLLMDYAGNPWGTYVQYEPCGKCGATMKPPVRRRPSQRVSGAIALRLNRIQTRLTRPHGDWIHSVFVKDPQS